MKKDLHAVHSAVYAAPPGTPLSYFGWPSVCRTDDGTLWAGASGFRASHIDPFGKTVLFHSGDDGLSWSAPEIVNNSLIDDRDVGLLALPGNRLLVSWFTSDTRFYQTAWNWEHSKPVATAWRDEQVADELGSLVRIRESDGTWGAPQFVKPTAPHGPVRLRSGRLFYLGRRFGAEVNGKIRGAMGSMPDDRLLVAVSDDGGATWRDGGRMELSPDALLCEPHAVELNDGRILAHIRVHGEPGMTVQQSISADGGLTWSPRRRIAVGSPPHLLRHSNGLLICSYGYRLPGYGQREMFSADEGENWDTDWIIRDDGDNSDLGYPCTVETRDGGLLTVYYQHPAGDSNAALLCSRWQLPKEFAR